MMHVAENHLHHQSLESATNKVQNLVLFSVWGVKNHLIKTCPMSSEKGPLEFLGVCMIKVVIRRVHIMLQMNIIGSTH